MHKLGNTNGSGTRSRSSGGRVGSVVGWRIGASTAAEGAAAAATVVVVVVWQRRDGTAAVVWGGCVVGRVSGNGREVRLLIVGWAGGMQGDDGREEEVVRSGPTGVMRTAVRDDAGQVGAAIGTHCRKVHGC